MGMLKAFIKKVLLKILPRSIVTKLKKQLNVISTWRQLPILFARQQAEIEALRGDVNRLLSLARLSKFNQFNDGQHTKANDNENNV